MFSEQVYKQSDIRNVKYKLDFFWTITYQLTLILNDVPVLRAQKSGKSS